MRAKLKPLIPYFLFLIFLLSFNAAILIVPILAMGGFQEANAAYVAFSPTCHQLTARSLCIFKSKIDSSLSIGDCTSQQTGQFSRAIRVEYEDKIGYKLPVCARDVGIYFAMLVGTLFLPLFQKPFYEEFPNKWILVAAAIPVGIDGATQLVGLRESTNALRLITGAIIGVVLPFYIMPILNSFAEIIYEKIRRR
ncbi:MAG: DUF2085 domain-containing protein [Candidatus Anstonellaceae archaeon]